MTITLSNAKDTIIVDNKLVFRLKLSGKRVYARFIGYTTEGIIEAVKNKRRK